MRIDEPVKIICVKNDLTMSEIAKRMGITPQALSQKIKRGTISLDDIDNIANVAGCKLECNFVLPGGERVPILRVEVWI